ncbi:M48 family metallopeptidase [Nostoc sp. FACHB-152]|uniref:M48 family metallopeptidase n=1 Tax=unclassified Nostoc TaxID=2593658 RepID=UPI0016860DDF|nr:MULTISPECIES: M48 family metallopeptidase [unclassified Nostoc]MBD2447052.1 M48 family metallopeptidase [Nostoc sp. FACHB-152]MBD2470335.1 M48 family metallopeptidase [Nostoc sp. FACHB-145]
MERKILSGLNTVTFQHPFDQKALTALNKTPGLPLLLKKVNEYGIDRLLRMQILGGEFRVTSRNFPPLHDAFAESCEILDLSPKPELYLFRGTGHIHTNVVGVENPMVSVNLEAMEWYSYEELLFAFGYEIARVKGKYIAYQQMANVMPMLKNIVNSTTFGLGGLAAGGIEIGLYNWIIMSKFTCDRAGLLACQDINVAITALMKLGGLPSEYINPDTIADFTAQAREFSSISLDNVDQVTKIFSFMEYQLPWSVMRASELLKWVDSGEYDKLLQAENLEKLEVSADNTEDSEDWQFMSSW